MFELEFSFYFRGCSESKAYWLILSKFPLIDLYWKIKLIIYIDLLFLLGKSACQTYYWQAYVVILSYRHLSVCSSNIYWVPIFVLGTILGTRNIKMN